MRRWLAVLRLVLLPLQFSWAAVANDCLHGPGVASSHPGHHDHAVHGHDGAVAQPQAQVDDTPPADLQPASHPDCNHCHGQGVAVVDARPGTPVPASGAAPSAAGQAPCPEPAPDRPDRPRWARLA